MLVELHIIVRSIHTHSVTWLNRSTRKWLRVRGSHLQTSLTVDLSEPQQNVG